MRSKLSLPQIIILAILWAVLCVIVLTSAKRIDGMLILSILISGALVFIPLYKYLKAKK